MVAEEGREGRCCDSTNLIGGSLGEGQAGFCCLKFCDERTSYPLSGCTPEIVTFINSVQEIKMFCKNEDLSGMKFGRWTVGTLAQAGTKRTWNCVCECGTSRVVDAQGLKRGTSKSCGCLQKELVAERSKTHGHSRKPGYQNWMEMKDRCYNEKSHCYQYYGAVGVYVAEELMDFDRFIDAIGPFPGSEYSIGRIDNCKPYCEGNVRWETKAQQARNRTMISSNKSGTTGVYLEKNNVDGVVYERWVGKYCEIGGKQVKKTFSVKKFGFAEARQMAEEFREAGIKALKEQGAGYSDDHGKPRKRVTDE